MDKNREMSAEKSRIKYEIQLGRTLGCRYIILIALYIIRKCIKQVL